MLRWKHLLRTVPKPPVPPMLLPLIWTFLINYLILFVVSYAIVEFAQSYFYDEVTPARTVKVAFGSLILAGVLTWTKSNFATMFTNDIKWTILQAIVWFGVFVLVYRFQPWHGGALALAAMLLICGTATMVVDSMLTPRNMNVLDTTKPVNKPPRRPTYGAPKGAVEPPPAAK